MAKYASGLSAGQYLGLLKADFSDLEKLDEICDKVLYRMMIRDYNQSQEKKYGVSFNDYKRRGLQEKGGFAGMVRSEIGRTLAIVRAAGQRKAEAAIGAHDRGNMASAVRYGVWKKQIGGSVNILSGGNRRKESKERAYRNRREASARTIQINRYYGRDRAWILRILNSGTIHGDRTSTNMNAHPIERKERPKVLGLQKNRKYKPQRNYKGGIGNRGSIKGSNFFASVNSDMQRAVEELGVRMENIANEVMETAFEEILKK